MLSKRASASSLEVSTFSSWDSSLNLGLIISLIVSSPSEVSLFDWQEFTRVEKRSSEGKIFQLSPNICFRSSLLKCICTYPVISLQAFHIFAKDSCSSLFPSKKLISRALRISDCSNCSPRVFIISKYLFKSVCSGTSIL